MTGTDNFDSRNRVSKLEKKERLSIDLHNPLYVADSIKSMGEQEPIHFSQAYNLNVPEKNLDFFDVNLKYDSLLFIDPFLIRKSSLANEKALFERFGDFFRYAYDKSLLVNEDPNEYTNLKRLLDFHEPKEIGLGFTEKSHDGAGPGPSFANILFGFFINSSAKRLVKEEGLYPNGQFNPITLEIFIDGLGPDGLSDLTANIIMDYLISYTQEQCNLLGVPLKSLPLSQDGFDFQEMEWRGGGYYDLPENPLKEGRAVILVPKRFLRAFEIENGHIQSKVKGILESDPSLSMRFSDFLSKKISEISIREIKELFLEEENIFKKYIELTTNEKSYNYDFEKDILKILAIKSYSLFFNNIKITEAITSCKQLHDITIEFINIFKEHCSGADGWRDMWSFKGTVPKTPQREAVMGRIFRAMGMAYFHRIKSVTFLAEVGTGNGPVDFMVINGDCRIVIEIKRLLNSSAKGNPPIAGYIHGIERQLPNYAKLKRANYAIYVTGQHWTLSNRPNNNHDSRAREIQQLLPTIESQMKVENPDFESLNYINIDFSPHPPASSI